MKKALFTISVFSFFLAILNSAGAQKAIGSYTLEEGEKIVYVEVDSVSGGSWYMVTVKSPSDYTLISNGTREQVQNEIQGIQVLHAANRPGISYFTQSLDNKKFYLITSGKDPDGPYSCIGETVISKDGLFYAFICEEGRDNYVKTSSGQVWGPYPDVNNLAISDKNDIAFSAVVDKKKSVVVNGDVIAGSFNDIDKVLFCSDGSVAYIQDTAGNYFIGSGGQNYGPYEDVSFIKKDPLSAGLVRAAKDKNDRIIVDFRDKTYGFFSDIYDFVFSQDFKQFAFIVEEEGDQYLFINGKLMFTGSKLADFVFSADGSKYAFSDKDKNLFYVYNMSTSEGPFLNISQIGFSGNDLFYGYEEIRGQWYVSFKGEKYGPYDKLGPIAENHSAKSKIAWNYLEDGLWYINTDGKDCKIVQPALNMGYSGNGEQLYYHYNFGNVKPTYFSLDFETASCIITGGQVYLGGPTMNNDGYYYLDNNTVKVVPF